ncbi:MAG: Ig-like domain-containing protein [Gemmatimonadota bacterium]|nr:Ig-like domain-containing protein [Gemmatimonadota bacterium]
MLTPLVSPRNCNSGARATQHARRRLICGAAAALIAAACQDHTGPARPLLDVASGDGQHAMAGTEVAEPVVVELRDGSQRPLVGVHVTWSAVNGAGDVISPQSQTTNANGDVQARWRLDATTGTHTLLATADGGATARARAYADARPVTNVNPMPVATYDGSGQAVHPDFVRLPSTWSGDPVRLVATPYPGGDATYENPSLYTGSTLTSWVVPEGVVNPLERPVGGSYLSDPDMSYDPDAGELRIYYRRVTTHNEIWMTRSSDGVVWTAPVLTVSAPNHFIVSPTIVRRGAGQWLMWSVNSGSLGCGAASTSVELRRSADGLTWSAPQLATISDPDGFPWHIDVEWIPSRNEYWAVYPVKVSGGCTTDRLRFATSADGLHWTTYPSPLLLKGSSDDLQDIVYRSSLDYDDVAGVVTLWYSGAKLDHGFYRWHLAWERMSQTGLFARVSTPVTAASRNATRATQRLPQLSNETAP